MQQDPAEFEHLIQVLLARQPRIERGLEIGVWDGGTLSRFHNAMPWATWVGIDKSRAPWSPFDIPRPQVVVGDSTDPAARMLALTFLGGPPDFIHIDGDHTLEGAAADLAWAVEMDVPLVTLHDIAQEEHPQLDVWALWQRLREEHPGQCSEMIYDGEQFGIGLWDRKA